MDFHLNALNLLEQGQCHNCVSIEKVTKLGNGLVDVDASITHPFPGLAQYTGFDVKGIVMFKGSVRSLILRGSMSSEPASGALSFSVQLGLCRRLGTA